MKSTKLSRGQLLLSVIAFLGVLAVIIPLVSHASTTAVVSFEAEDGVLTGCSAIATDSAASGAKAVTFGNCPFSPLTLDTTGNTIPDTNYTIPSGAIYLSTTGNDANNGTSISTPVATITKAVALVPSGGTIVMRAGTYRQWLSNSAGTNYAATSKPMTIQAYPHEQVWFDGMDIVPTSNWTSDGAGHWSETLDTPSFCAGGYYSYPYNAQSSSNTGPCSHADVYGSTAANYPAAGDPQMIYINGTFIPEVDTLAGVTANSFFYDWSAKKVYIGTDPSGKTVEAATRPVALILSGASSKILGIGFKRYATNEYSNVTIGAVYLVGANSTFENGVTTQNAGGGLYVAAKGGVLRHSVLANNGYNGMGSNGHQHSDGSYDGLLIEDNVIASNNREQYGINCSASCGSSGIKIAHMDGFTLRNNIIINNIGKAHGFWCDLACSNGVMVNNYVANNGNSGIFYEVSDTGIIASNMVVNNHGYGIRSASANTKIYNNTMVNNTNSGQLWIYDDSRSYGYAGWTDVGPDTVNDQIANNVMYDTTGANAMVRVQGTLATQTNTVPSQFFSYFDYNAYFRGQGPNQYLYRWIPQTEVDYRLASSFAAATGWDSHAIDISSGSDPFFISSSSNNYVIRSTSTAFHAGIAIPSDVAAAAGLSTAAGQNMGALTYPDPNN